MTKAERREICADYNEFAAWMKISMHFFPLLPQWLNNMVDPRNKDYITYSAAVLVLMCIMKCVCGVVTMRSMNEAFARNEALCNLMVLTGEEPEEMPDWQTANNYLKRLNPKELDRIRIQMINTLIRSKQFYDSRLLGCWRIILDGSGIAYFKERHCEHDLVTKHKNPETGEETFLYYHKVLEAKIVLAKNLVLSIGTEFIENENAEVDKQDCETRAAERLLMRIKEQFPRLPIVVQGDGLYATMPMMKLCTDLNWHYLFTLKNGCQPILMRDFKDMLKMEDFADHYEVQYREEKGTASFVNHVEQFSGKSQICNVFQYDTVDEKGHPICFIWITDLPITKRNIRSLVDAGRGRWAIENLGFNNQKNGIYKIEHLCSKDPNGIKNHYLITQISDILMQLYLAFDKMIWKLKKSLKNSAMAIREKFVGVIITDEMCKELFRRTTMRLNTKWP